MLEIRIEDLRTLSEPPDADAVVVIDVLRAFSTAAVALNRGVPTIFPVREVEEAFARRRQDPSLILMGENECRPIAGFELGNSPVEADAFEFHDRRVIQRTSAGTRGLVACSSARSLWAASFLVAKATISALQVEMPKRIALIATGTVHGNDADEDFACAEWMSELLHGRNPPVTPYLRRVRNSKAASVFLDPANPLYAPADVKFCAQADIFSFAMKVEAESGRLVLRRCDKRWIG